MEGDGSPLSSLCMVRAAELFPRPEPEKEDDSLKVPFTELAGEFVRYIGRTDDGILALSNYRICLKSQTTTPETEISIPLGVIEYATVRDLFQLVVSCKDASTFKCTFPTSEQCSDWQRRITLSIGVPTSLETLFAFSYYAWASELQTNTENEWIGRMQRATNYDEDFRREVKRLDFNTSTSWRISTANVDFKLCPSYPRLLLVPMCITDEILANVASFRSARRIPAVVWRHKASGAVIGRCSQPEVGWLGWRNPKDEQLLKAIADACAFDGGELGRRQQQFNNVCASENSSTDGSHEEVCMDEVKKILIVDARSYASAVTNRARGGGCECPEYYPCAAIEFMNLGNIHVIRKSFHALRSLAASPTDSQSWFTSLDRTMWLTHLAGMMQSAMRICHAVEREGRSVIVHCSDGWDRTPQLVSTALLCLDPYYRTVDGFRTLVEREWLSFGHKFADRIGHGPGSDETNERCPVFLQWLDCVHQIQKQFPCSFEFSMAYLIKLAQHVFSCMFGTFMCNTYKERIDNSVFDRTYSVWPFLSGPMYKNPLYIANREQVLWPAYHASNLSFWSEVYESSFGNQNQSDSSMTTSISPTAPVVASATGVGTTIVTPSTNDISNSEPRSPMIKTRSYGDLQTAGSNGSPSSMIRRSSDPNMSLDAHFNLNLSSEPSVETLPKLYANGTDSDADIVTDETIANYCSDTIRELNNLTEELQHTDLLNGTDHRSNNEKCKENNSNYNNLESTLTMSDNIQSDKSENEMVQNHNFDNMYRSSVQNSDKLSETSDKECDYGNSNCDVVDSSPFYTQTNHRSDDDQEAEKTIHLNSWEDHHREIKSYENLNECSNGINGINGTNCTNGTKGTNGHIKNSDNDRKMPNSSHSIDLKDTISSLSTSSTIQSQWHGNVETSTDTLVPVIESANQHIVEHNYSKCSSASETDADVSSSHFLYRARVLPDVHGSSKSKPYSNGSLLTNALEDSILIQPEQQCMDISNGTRHDPIPPSITSSTTTPATAIPNGNANHSSLYRRRQNSLNSKSPPTFADVVIQSHTRAGSISPVAMSSKFIIPNTSRPLSIVQPTSNRLLGSQSHASPNISSFSSPDGLAHALSEQNLRLQQIVHEHKIREEALQKELQALRLALLKKRTCSNCSNGQISNSTTTNINADETDDDDESFVAQSKCSSSLSSRQSSEGPSFNLLMKNPSWASSRTANSMIDNGVENVSICSWEAVEERSGSSSAKNSLNPSSVLWVPDHAVSRCISCQTEFWLGRRKHHCRSCGQIFCADCSEFFAPLPDEHLYTPVRLCGPCYNSVTIKCQNYDGNPSSIISNNGMTSSFQVHTNSHYLSNGSMTSSTVASTANTLEPCKSSVVSSKNEQSPTKTTTVMN